MAINNHGIQSLKFGFENCEDAYINPSFIGLFYIKNIQISLGRLPCSNYNDIPIDYHKHCDSFVISIYRLYNKIWKNYNHDTHYHDLFDRLKINNIVNLRIVKSNDVTENIYLPWSNDEYINKFQKTIQNKSGDIFIFVSKDEKEFDNIVELIEDTRMFGENEELEEYFWPGRTD